MSRRISMNRRGSILIGSYLMLSMFLVYSNAITQQTISQRMASERLRQRMQAMDLSRGAMDQLREDLFSFLSVNVYQLQYQGNAVKALAWLDDLGAYNEKPLFDTDDVGNPPDGKIEIAERDGTRNGTRDNPTTVSLPTVQNGGTDFARAWIRSITTAPGDDPQAPPDPLAPRYVTIIGEAHVGGTTKTLQSTYEVALGMSDIFRYAYFINNYGWLDSNNDMMMISGEVRSNGDFTFGHNVSQGMPGVHGDVYASANPSLKNPITGQPSMGTITGDPWQMDRSYWMEWHEPSSRPPRQITADGQPDIGGKPKILPYGYGWDSEYKNPVTGEPDQRKFSAQPAQPIPFLGDLSFYKDLADQKSGTLKYKDFKTGEVKTINGVYYGPDGVKDTADDKDPLVLIGDWNNPIEVNGPVVIPGDVIVRGLTQGRGTVYAGRNIHITGETNYKDDAAFRYEELERDTSNGDVRLRWSGGTKLGRVCNDGTYFTQPEVDLGAGCP